MVGGSNDAISGYIKSKSKSKWRPAVEHLGKFRMAISPQKDHAIHFMLRFYGRVYRAPILYSTLRAVIFAIAQLACNIFIFQTFRSVSALEVLTLYTFYKLTLLTYLLTLPSVKQLRYLLCVHLCCSKYR